MSQPPPVCPEILRRLGEELVPDAHQGIVELARTLLTTLTQQPVSSASTASRPPAGNVTITDNGDGMSHSDIADGWLVFGRSSKDRRTLTRLNRVPAGDKGLGRLAALRLANVAALTTRPRLEPGVEYQMELDWRRFDEARLVEDVPVVYTPAQYDGGAPDNYRAAGPPCTAPPQRSATSGMCIDFALGPLRIGRAVFRAGTACAWFYRNGAAGSRP